MRFQCFVTAHAVSCIVIRDAVRLSLPNPRDTVSIDLKRASGQIHARIGEFGTRFDLNSYHFSLNSLCADAIMRVIGFILVAQMSRFLILDPVG